MYADMSIEYRIPYHMPGELTVLGNAPGNQFADAVFSHNVNKPFEIHRMIVRLTAFDGAVPPAILAVQPGTLEKLIRLRIADIGHNEVFTKNAALVDTLICSEAGSCGSWEWEDPYTVTREGIFQISVDSLVYPAGTTNIRVEVSLQGFLIIIAPPTEDR
jgi:hypothetical protein